MKIIELRAQNVKRLRAVDITPDGTLQVIGGRNAQGKSSVLDAIWLALGGGKASKETPLPIRDGEQKASVRLDLGELVVTRTWTQKGTSLKVENAEGAQYKSPQGMLDELLSGLSFDPLAFTRLSAREQKEALLDLVDLGIDLDALEAEKKAAYDQRTEIGRQGKAIGDVTVDESLPAEETSASEIIATIRSAGDSNAIRERLRGRSEACAADVERLEKELQEARLAFDDALAEEAAAPKFVDVAPLQEQLATIEETNAAIRANNTARAKAAEKQRLAVEWKRLSGVLDALDAEKAKALKAAKFPVAGLSFDESGVLYNGVPLSQASSAEQIRVSVAMGMALNPKLRVLMIKDGSLLDEDSMAAIRQQVTDGGFQLWIERVGDADQGAVILEDGEVQA